MSSRSLAQDGPAQHDPVTERDWSHPLDGIKRDRAAILSQLTHSIAYMEQARHAMASSDDASLERAFAGAYRAYRLLRFAHHGIHALVVRDESKTLAQTLKPASDAIFRAMRYNRVAHSTFRTYADRAERIKSSPVDHPRETSLAPGPFGNGPRRDIARRVNPQRERTTPARRDAALGQALTNLERAIELSRLAQEVL